MAELFVSFVVSAVSVCPWCSWCQRYVVRDVVLSLWCCQRYVVHYVVRGVSGVSYVCLWCLISPWCCRCSGCQRAREDMKTEVIAVWKIPVNRGENLTAKPSVKDMQRQKQQQQAKAGRAVASSSSSWQQAAAAMATSSTDEGWQAATRSGERRQQAAAAGKAERSFTFNFPLSPSPFTFRPSTFHFALAHFSPLPPSPSPFTFDHAPSPCTMHFPPCTVHLAPFTYSPFTLPCRSGARPRGTA